MWSILVKIWKNKKLLVFVKTVIFAMTDGKITKDEAKKISNDAIEAFMKE